MKKYLIPVAAVALLFMGSCTKKTETINNYNYHLNGQPPFSVGGLSDINFVSFFTGNASQYITLNYIDSIQEGVTLSISGLPNGVQIDSNWVTGGVPSFNTSFYLYDTTDQGVTPGIYNAQLTATTTSGRVFNYPFHINVKPMPASFLGAYDSCISYCTYVVYHDSLWQDASTANKIWFRNFNNSGNQVYGYLKNGTINIPKQTVGGILYAGNASVYLPGHLNVSFSGGCGMDMWHR